MASEVRGFDVHILSLPAHRTVSCKRAGREKCEAMAPVGLREFSTAREVPAVTTLR